MVMTDGTPITKKYAKMEAILHTHSDNINMSDLLQCSDHRSRLFAGNCLCLCKLGEAVTDGQYVVVARLGGWGNWPNEVHSYLVPRRSDWHRMHSWSFYSNLGIHALTHWTVIDLWSEIIIVKQ